MGWCDFWVVGVWRLYVELGHWIVFEMYMEVWEWGFVAYVMNTYYVWGKILSEFFVWLGWCWWF